MPRLLTATALCLLTLATSTAYGGGTAPQPTMSPVTIVEDTADTSHHILVPIFAVILIAAALHSVGSGGLGPTPSDARLKRDMTPVGTAANGLTLYEYRYIWADDVQTGVMAQEVLAHTPEAVVALPHGYMAVDYGMLGLQAQSAP